METRTVPTISVVMPAYNAERYIAEAIDSILAQTFTDFEFIIINDGSTDRTKEIILSYNDPRIIYIENEENSGICVTLNKGLDSARGKYIARMDSDDISLPNRFEMQVRYMDAHPEISVCGSDFIVFGEGIKEYTFKQVHDSDDCAAGLIFNPCLAHPSVMIRKTILDNNKISYNNDFRGLEDFKMWWEIAQHARITNLPITLLKYRHHPGQETKNIKPTGYIASNQFRALRYNSFGLALTDKECEIVNNYSYGHFDRFGIDEIETFLKILADVCRSKKYPIITTRRSIQTVCGKAIAYTLAKSPELRRHKRQYLTKAFLKGVISPLWYMKYLKASFI